MATTLYFRHFLGTDAIFADSHHWDGRGRAIVDTTTDWVWMTAAMRTTRPSGSTAATSTAPSTTGTTLGVNLQGSSNAHEGVGRVWTWISPPIAEDVTILGTITLNLWGHESSMNANMAINCRISKLDGATGAVTVIAKSIRTTELGTTAAAANFTVAPTTTTMKRGDRFIVEPFFDDGGGTMASGFTGTFTYNSPTAAGTGDSWIQFNETFTFENVDGEPSGTTLYMTSTAHPDVSTANDDRVLGRSRSSSVVTIAEDISTGQTSGIHMGVVDWFSPRLQAFTLGGLAKVRLKAWDPGGGGGIYAGAVRVEIAVVDADGSNPVVWASANLGTRTNPATGGISSSVFLFANAEPAAGNHYWLFPAGDDLAVTDGQRLRLRVYVEDSYNNLYDDTGTRTINLRYGGSSGGSGDSYVILPQTVTDYTVLSQAQYRFRNDDGDESTATWKAAVNTPA